MTTTKPASATRSTQLSELALQQIAQIESFFGVDVEVRWVQHSGMFCASVRSLEFKHGGVLTSIGTGGHAYPSTAVNEIYVNLRTGGNLIVKDAYGTRDGRQEFRFDDATAQWVVVH